MNLKKLKTVSLSVGVVACALSPISAFAQRGQPVPLTLVELKPNVYVAQGGAGGNAGVLIGDSGVVVIDAKQTPEGAQEMLAAIAKLTPKPVTHVILTGIGSETMMGLAGFPASVKVIAHQTVKTQLDKRVAAGRGAAPPADKMPTQLLNKPREVLTLNGIPMQVLQIAPGHFPGDTEVYLPNQKIVFTGYLFQQNPPATPIIHGEQEGSSLGWLESAKAVLALDADTYIIGAGSLTKAEIAQRVADQEAALAKITQLVAQGKTKDEMRVALGTAPVEGGKPPSIYSFSEVAYDELTRGK